MEITLRGTKIHTIGQLPRVGTKAPDFTLIKTDLSPIHLDDIKGKNVVMNIFVSIDTPVCAESVKQFNKSANKMDNTIVLCISKDLPFAQQRYCGAECLNNVIPVSAFRNPEFGKDYGLTIIDGPLAGLLSRAVVILDTKHNIVYTEQVPEIGQEPNYKSAIDHIPI